MMPSLYSSTAQPGYTILDVDANAYLFVGGLTEKVKVIKKKKIMRWWSDMFIEQ